MKRNGGEHRPRGQTPPPARSNLGASRGFAAAGANPRPTILAEITALQQAGRRGVLATPLWSLGSAPVGRTAKLLVRGDGTTVGTVGGGALEAEVLRVAAEVGETSLPRLLEFDLNPSAAAALGMICGGRCAIFVEAVRPDANAEAFAAAEIAESMGESVALITVIAGDAARKMAVSADGRVVGSTGNAETDRALVREALDALADGRSRYLEQPIKAHIEAILPRPSVFIFGAGHIAVPLAHIAEMVGFAVTVVDDRADFANRERFPTADAVMVAGAPDAFSALPIGEDDYVVAVTRGHVMDEEVVAGALRARARYVGMIGSRRKVAQVRERLRARGFSDDDLDRVHAPIGLDIGADTVEEIAVSIVAELIRERRGSS